MLNLGGLSEPLVKNKLLLMFRTMKGGVRMQGKAPSRDPFTLAKRTEASFTRATTRFNRTDARWGAFEACLRVGCSHPYLFI